MNTQVENHRKRVQEIIKEERGKMLEEVKKEIERLEFKVIKYKNKLINALETRNEISKLIGEDNNEEKDDSVTTEENGNEGGYDRKREEEILKKKRESRIKYWAEMSTQQEREKNYEEWESYRKKNGKEVMEWMREGGK
ncbi:U2 small nuclear ribonucleoprotein auxiliary factor 35 kDa subunit-related protein 2-like [Leptopilina boulardi]|uniref:U2 small nuclear ribonucleoprotein auxiliary factor 35 kDa subunit-related protein 2-like n=1 Tax=Leptopilina boulardi TaxID=63433 RepID=UPI0021F6612D|nr:U2 small nuclear ribonucleoprotein auxiliary factor 35 kDa subunit-related protein 2-like [Leptopilina boulardi]